MAALVPGTFDPFTLGHLDVVEQAAALFDEVVVAVAASEGKGPLLSLDRRLEAAAAAVVHLGNVRCRTFEGLLVDLVAEEGAACVVRGVRGAADLAAEMELALTNRLLARPVPTCLLIPAPERLGLSSRLVRQVLACGGDPTALVGEPVARLLRRWRLVR
ncbi:MAG: pantetheine-phosphate adenylyltransferase [Nitrospirae bacterium]|nr:MAG: pantetheine-phosphate adenylyltransferase [Nitrospirota bacterium]